MTVRLEYLAHCPDRATLVAVMAALQNPLTGEPLATLIGDSLFPSEGLWIDEIGPVTKPDGTVVPGHHVNLCAVGRLAALLNANGGWTAIFPLLGDMQEMPQSDDGVPQGWQGTSGMRIFPRSAVDHSARVWIGDVEG